MTELTSAPLRVSNADREETVARLHHALGEGRLDLDETETRSAAAYAATHHSDLEPLLADLPATHDTRSGAPSWNAVWASAVWRAETVLLGPATAAPDARRCRRAAVLTLLAVVWMIVCAFLGAALVAS